MRTNYVASTSRMKVLYTSLVRSFVGVIRNFQNGSVYHKIKIFFLSSPDTRSSFFPPSPFRSKDIHIRFHLTRTSKGMEGGCW
uniref:Uncharacterized protein n=1 Tax=Utricularia reniformis TaxID=192314 RepID=A0A1Y0B124_9LAMI|nr:hypothetical protein AEK19_MT0842 [Utricularia reniformis]YP_009382295.1 hypothetical protein AEK19_MT1867 [Utricularia reniformis]ART31074.1 hypothetical protein AEK19_MT0842 [Utricularia reniformis]ART32037.1 hypothetical protein AEK19_MT1867 [Utricularia reniformis]